MPQVPTYDNFQANVSTPSAQGVASPEFKDFSSNQTAELGAAMQGAGQEMGAIANDMQQHINQLRTDDALNQAKEIQLQLQYGPQGYSNLKGINALQRPNGKPLDAEYGDMLKDKLSAISDGLGNDAQKQMFHMAANDMLTSFKGQVMQHMVQQSNVYALSTSQGIQDTAMRDIALNYNNPDAINAAVNRIKAETYRQAQLQGYSAEWQEAQSRKLTSQGHKLALMTALENNQPAYAQSYLSRYKDQMDADDILTVQGHVTNEANAALAMNAVGNLTATHMNSLDPGPGSRLFNLLLGQESGGQQTTANGQPVTSSKGAIGVAQVMPKTAPEAAKLAGLEWDENRYKTDAGYNKALGLAYFQKQLQDFGNYQQALAAYNAGPGATQQAIAQAQKDGKADQWLSYLPKETQGYVSGISAKFEAGLGAPPKPTMLDLDAQLRQDPSLANNPKALALARDQLQQRYKDITDAVKQRNDDAVVTAMRNVEANGGNYFGLDATTRMAIPPDQVDKVKNFAKSVANGADYTDLALYQKLATDPQYLKGLTDSEFYKLRTGLSVSDFQHFTQERNKLLNPQGINGNNPGDLDSGAIKIALDRRLNQIGISTTQISGNDSLRVGGIRAFVDQYLLSAQRNAGKKFNDADINNQLDTLFAKNDTIKGFFWDSGKPIMSMQAGDIDSDTRDNIKKGFAASGITDPTDQQILNQYWLSKVIKR